MAAEAYDMASWKSRKPSKVGKHPLSAHRLPKNHLLRAPKAKDDRPRASKKWTQSCLKTYEKLVFHSASKSCLPASLSMRCLTAFPWQRHSSETIGVGNYLRLVFPKRCRSSDLVQKYLGSVVPYSDNFFAALNAAVFSDGSFCYIPRESVPMELSTYFRINAAETVNLSAP